MTKAELYIKTDKVSTYASYGSGDKSGYSVKSEIMKIVADYCAVGESDYLVRLTHANAELAAKVFAYEQFITKSNFAPFVAGNDAHIGCGICRNEQNLLQGEDWSVYIGKDAIRCCVGGDEHDYRVIKYCPECDERLPKMGVEVL